MANYRVALTGGIASGKSQVAALFAEHSIAIIDADEIARRLVEPGTQTLTNIAEHFGEKILNEKGELNRKKLRQIIFSDPDQKKWLENQLHPEIRAILDTESQAASTPYVVVMIPLLVENPDSPLTFDRILLVDAPVETQRQRLQDRDHCTLEEADNIIAQQASRETRQKKADDILLNDATVTALKVAVDKLHEQYLKLAQSALPQ